MELGECVGVSAGEDLATLKLLNYDYHNGRKEGAGRILEFCLVFWKNRSSFRLRENFEGIY